MSVRESTPNIRIFECTPEKEDGPGMPNVLTYTCNLDSRTLSISGDIRNTYTYSWGSGRENLLHLLSRLDEEYLLDKIASRTQLNLTESIEETINIINLTWPDDTEQDRKDKTAVIQEIRNLSCSCEVWSEEQFYTRTVTAIKSYGSHPMDTWEIPQIVKDYPHEASTAAALFIKHVQPFLKETCEREGIENTRED